MPTFMTRRMPWIVFLALISIGAALAAAPVSSGSRASAVEVDTALILAVDVSNSVDETRYKLQMEGIARSLTDEGVLSAIMSGQHGGILISLVFWAEKAEVAMDWQIIRNAEDAAHVADLMRALPLKTGEFTCMSRMLEFVGDRIVDDISAKTKRVVLDVSGDGIDNCRQEEESRRERDALVAKGVTINGLPIIVKGENDIVGSGAYRAPGFGMATGPDTHETTLDRWYTKNVIGGRSGFVLKANGFEDFGRAFRQKFVSEISLAE
jgi:hypothetical protein